MSVIIDGCPFHDVETAVETPSGALPVRAYQIIVWVGVSLRGSVSRAFPAVLDTGHSHNFSITDEKMPSLPIEGEGYVRPASALAIPLQLERADVSLVSARGVRSGFEIVRTLSSSLVFSTCEGFAGIDGRASWQESVGGRTPAVIGQRT